MITEHQDQSSPIIRMEALRAPPKLSRPKIARECGPFPVPASLGGWTSQRRSTPTTRRCGSGTSLWGLFQVEGETEWACERLVVGPVIRALGRRLPRTMRPTRLFTSHQVDLSETKISAAALTGHHRHPSAMWGGKLVNDQFRCRASSRHLMSQK